MGSTRYLVPPLRCESVKDLLDAIPYPFHSTLPFLFTDIVAAEVTGLQPALAPNPAPSPANTQRQGCHVNFSEATSSHVLQGPPPPPQRRPALSQSESRPTRRILPRAVQSTCPQGTPIRLLFSVPCRGPPPYLRFVPASSPPGDLVKTRPKYPSPPVASARHLEKTRALLGVPLSQPKRGTF